MFLVVDKRTRRMHAVPESYFEAFAVKDVARRTSGVWRFDRLTSKAKLLGVSDVEISKDIYLVFDKDGTPDTGIENKILCNLEGVFCSARDSVHEVGSLSKENWSGLFRFVAAQLIRTPRFFQMMRYGLAANGDSYDQDILPRIMLELIDRWITRLARMRGVLAYNETDVPLLTCDNPAAAWKKAGEGINFSIDQRDPELMVSCPLSPTLMLVAYQTPASLKAVYAEQYDLPRSERKSETFTAHIDIGSLPKAEVVRLNNVCVKNAQRYIYANYSDEHLANFLQSHFFGASAPFRLSGYERTATT